MSEHSRDWLRKGAIAGFWLVVWQCVSMAVGNSIILVGPKAMLSALLQQIPTPEFWLSITTTFGKISAGFLSAFVLGIFLAAVSYRQQFIKELLSPVMQLMKSIPVASFVVLALIWMGSKNLSVLISFLVVLPVIYVNTLAGLNSTDKKLLEMAQVFRVSPWKKVWYLYREAVMPYLVSGCKVALGMSWKSGVAAEVIGVPEFSIGERLYMAKIYLNTADLFAWTFVIIGLSALFEKLFLLVLRRAAGGGQND